ncbi:MAG TPA: hypothetical protein VFI52_13340 [Gemmatimonadaceae bacterium]|nr:hypothetical protein [Gemmatimonadaceae bacterium]
MIGSRLSALIAAAGVLAATPAQAQRRDSTASVRADTSTRSLSCPRTGALLHLWSGAAPDSTGRPTATPGADTERGPIDTVITLDIADRSWQRDSLSAGVSLGVAGTAGARHAPWHACAGATATLQRITITLHDVHGQIHLKADPGALAAIGRTPGSTPPAPPRR